MNEGHVRERDESENDEQKNWKSEKSCDTFTPNQSEVMMTTKTVVITRQSDSSGGNGGGGGSGINIFCAAQLTNVNSQ